MCLVFRNFFKGIGSVIKEQRSIMSFLELFLETLFINLSCFMVSKENPLNNMFSAL